MRSKRIALLLVAAATFVRLVLAAAIPLFPDETYYWEWSRHLAAGYFDHPPAVALLIRFGTTLFGPTALGVRFGSVLAGAIASLALVSLSERLTRSDDGSGFRAMPDGDGALSGGASTAGIAGARAALLMLVIPASLAGFVLATPDAPLFASAALTLLAVDKAIAASVRSPSTLGWWCAAGLALGVAFCAKYTAVLIPLGVLIALLLSPTLRARLATPGPYVAATIALLVVTPTMVWNAHHNWISFAFQLQHGLGVTHGSGVSREFGFVSAQLGLVSPILAVLMAGAVAHALRRAASDRIFLLAILATTVIGFFAISAVRKPVEANWPLPALVAALPLLAAYQIRRAASPASPASLASRWFTAGWIVAAACTLVVSLQALTGLLPIPPRKDPIARAHGWDDLARAVDTERAHAQNGACNATWIAADRYQEASELAFHLPHHPRVFALNLGGRPNQYDLWPRLRSVTQPGDCVLVAVDEGATGETVIRRLHPSSAVNIAIAVMTWRGVPIGRRAMWLVRGLPQERTESVTLSPAGAAQLASIARSFVERASLLDSIETVFRHGPVPYIVTNDTAAPVSNTDRQAALSARLANLHSLLARLSAGAVYRDARYPDCTFIRTESGTTPHSASNGIAEAGYVYAPAGCRLAGRTGDQRMALLPTHGAWYAYAVPASAESSPDRANQSRASTTE